jgi:putative transposase
VPMLRQIEVQTAQSHSIAVACEDADVSERSYDPWCKEYDGLKVDPAKSVVSAKLFEAEHSHA